MAALRAGPPLFIRRLSLGTPSLESLILIIDKGCEEKHSYTTAHHPVVTPPAVVSTAVSHTPTQQQGRPQDGGLLCGSASLHILCGNSVDDDMFSPTG